MEGPRDWNELFGVNGLYAPRSWNGVRPGVRNDIQTKDADGVRRTVFDWDMFMAYRFGGSADEGSTNGLRMVGWDATFTPYRNVKIKSTALGDPKEHRVDSMDNSITLGDPKHEELMFDWYHSHPDDPASLNRPADPLLASYGYNTLPSITLASIALTHRFNDLWAANGFVRYNITDRDLQEVGGYLQYDLDCLTFRLNAGFIPPITRTDGSRRPVDYRFAFFMAVKALQPDNIQKMQGW